MEEKADFRKYIQFGNEQKITLLEGNVRGKVINTLLWHVILHIQNAALQHKAGYVKYSEEVSIDIRRDCHCISY